MSLHISELFYSVQAEGISTGVPSIFIRLKDCNLLCGHGPGATWVCDTIPVWKKGIEQGNEWLEFELQRLCNLEWIKSRRVHLIFTGGEPLLLRNMRGIAEFLAWFCKKHQCNPFVEIETNGTINECEFLYEYIDQVNCSPKLSNSGMNREKRIVPDAIGGIINHPCHQFKFVVSNESDILEAENDFIRPFSIPEPSVVLMPGVDKLENLSERTRFIYDMAKRYGYRAITRGHILAWDQVTGV